jgi:hypothetical protein
LTAQLLLALESGLIPALRAATPLISLSCAFNSSHDFIIIIIIIIIIIVVLTLIELLSL